MIFTTYFQHISHFSASLGSWGLGRNQVVHLNTGSLSKELQAKPVQEPTCSAPRDGSSELRFLRDVRHSIWTWISKL